LGLRPGRTRFELCAAQLVFGNDLAALTGHLKLNTPSWAAYHGRGAGAHSPWLARRGPMLVLYGRMAGTTVSVEREDVTLWFGVDHLNHGRPTGARQNSKRHLSFARPGDIRPPRRVNLPSDPAVTTFSKPSARGRNGRPNLVTDHPSTAPHVRTARVVWAGVGAVPTLVLGHRWTSRAPFEYAEETGATSHSQGPHVGVRERSRVQSEEVSSMQWTRSGAQRELAEFLCPVNFQRDHRSAPVPGPGDGPGTGRNHTCPGSAATPPFCKIAPR